MSGAVSAGFGSELDRLLRQTNEHLGAAGRRVAKFIDENRQTVLASSAAALGGYIGTSDATVLRTIQALGFAGLSDLKQAILKSADKVSTPADHMRRTLADLEKSTGQAVESVLQAHADGFAVLQSEKCRSANRRGCPRSRRRGSHCGVRYRTFGGTCRLCGDVAGPLRPCQPYDQRDRLDAGGSVAGPSAR